MEITLDKPLKPDLDEQALMLFLEEPYVADLEMKGVHMPDGSFVKPEVQLVDLAGNTYTWAGRRPQLHQSDGFGLVSKR